MGLHAQENVAPLRREVRRIATFMLYEVSSMQKSDIPLLLIIAATTVLFTLYGLPFCSQFGHAGLAVPVYFSLAVLFLYGRKNRLPKSHKPRTR
jgi:hypothetical protein